MCLVLIAAFEVNSLWIDISKDGGDKRYRCQGCECQDFLSRTRAFLWSPGDGEYQTKLDIFFFFFY